MKSPRVCFLSVNQCCGGASSGSLFILIYYSTESPSTTNIANQNNIYYRRIPHQKQKSEADAVPPLRIRNAPVVEYFSKKTSMMPNNATSKGAESELEVHGDGYAGNKCDNSAKGYINLSLHHVGRDKVS